MESFSDNYNNWHWQNAQAVTTIRQLAEALNLPENDLAGLNTAISLHPLKITPYYLSLLKQDKPDGPLRKMVVPSASELTTSPEEISDPIGDYGKYRPVPRLTHRHPERILISPTMACAGYCRYCFRRARVGKNSLTWSASNRREALNYLTAHVEIKEVILTGGDPLMLPDAELIALLQDLRQIPHIRILRLHTRMPAYNPFRITETLIQSLAELNPLWIVTHFNHPAELTPTLESYLKPLSRVLPLLNQSVLLRGINDNVATLRELFWRLGELEIKPYYLHHPDQALGTRHLRPDLKTGRDLWKKLWGTMPGYLMPQYVLDIPGGHGKIPLNYQYAAEEKEKFRVTHPQSTKTSLYGET